ncbi:DUF1054 family protein [Companilactobacillus mishanensis]|uniref:DUF1054 family protein n=1 Tax=Companilactobacillus mishanensis TaxID=2486008 RepID=A0A5P0ZGU2_9LACO|nr:DUF1054 family protein [Companilactobacillus mishanensis]MQS44030.1 DUF1054 family protein [Companilactobacillus mishanensis]MQS52239.1 DUF1054 family protein [Companilactobacillus mishanensis]
MFEQKDFDVFNDDTLDGRLNLIKQNLDPKFQEIGDRLLSALEKEYQDKFYMKIAKHQRRTKNPPPDTWLAISMDKKGYKRNPHIELGLWPDRYFVTFGLLADAYNRPDYYPELENLSDSIISNKWLVSNDHTVAEMKDAEGYPDVLKRYKKVKSSDLVVGFNLMKDDPIVKAGSYDDLLFDSFMNLSKYMVDLNREV